MWINRKCYIELCAQLRKTEKMFQEQLTVIRDLEELKLKLIDKYIGAKTELKKNTELLNKYVNVCADLEKSNALTERLLKIIEKWK